MLSSSGTGEANANGEEVRPNRGRKSKMRHSSVKLEADTVPSLSVSVVHNPLNLPMERQ